MANWNEVKAGMTIGFKGAPEGGVIVKEIEMSGDALFGGIKVTADTGEIYECSALHAMSIYAKPAVTTTVAKPAGKLVDAATGQPTYGPCDDNGNPIAYDAHEDGSVWVQGNCLPHFRFVFAETESALETDVLDGVVTVAEAAQLTGRAEITIRKAIERGNLSARQSGATWLIRRADVEKRWGIDQQLHDLLSVFDDEWDAGQPIPDGVSDEAIKYAITRGYIERAMTPGGLPEGAAHRFAKATESGILWHWNNRA